MGERIGIGIYKNISMRAFLIKKGLFYYQVFKQKKAKKNYDS